MIYRNFKDKKLSLLGMGGMRFPCDENGEVDFEKTQALFDLCMKNGINYFDTAWFYHKGKSEEIMGKILSKYDRDSYFVATKMPWDEYENSEDVDALFEKQLERTGLDYFDFYLFHNVSENTVKYYIDEKYGVHDVLMKKKKEGKIRHLGFSTHGSLETMEDFILRYRDDLEFCQIQLNWLDWTLQNAKEKVELLNKYNLPIWVMEGVRGGYLASLSEEDEARLKALRPHESIAAWSFRFLQSIPNVAMILSGMSDSSQIEDNIKTFSDEKVLSEVEQNVLFEIGEKILSKRTLTCTNCKYCMEECPQELEIPKLLSLFNQMCLVKNNPSVERVKEKTEKLPSLCIGCGACQKKCPQKIEISSILAEFAQKLG
ncbi:MAG: aldo/keto reductase [Clostridia bacterium]|nr:aldo/keto reductase [Clostridia bacterium]